MELFRKGRQEPSPVRLSDRYVCDADESYRAEEPYGVSISTDFGIK